MKKTKISFYINIFIFISTLFALTTMLAGFYFMGEEKLLTDTKLGAFKFFTVDSNVLMGIASIIFAFYECKLMNNKIKEIPKFLYILKVMATLGVTVTFLITLLYLAPYSDNFLSLYKNSNLFFHFIIPILSFITFVIFEKSDKIKFRNTFYGLIPFVLYGIYYIINILTHEKTIKYDFYNFTNNGNNSILVAFILVIIFVYLIDLCIWFLNKKRGKSGKSEK